MPASTGTLDAVLTRAEPTRGVGQGHVCQPTLDAALTRAEPIRGVGQGRVCQPAPEHLMQC